jgi:hypothetical protein
MLEPAKFSGQLSLWSGPLPHSSAKHCDPVRRQDLQAARHDGRELNAVGLPSDSTVRDKIRDVAGAIDMSNLLKLDGGATQVLRQEEREV